MTDSEKQASWWLLPAVLLAAAVMAGVWMALGPPEPSGNRQSASSATAPATRPEPTATAAGAADLDAPAGPSASAGATAPVGAASPSLISATAPATTASAAAQRWSPPKFTERQKDRDAMVQTIKQYGLEDAGVLAAMAAVPRHEFVPKEYLARAYGDHPLPIGHGQTISQPYIVAEMTRQLNLTDKSRVLEIGTGSGYQAAVLTHFTPHVYSVEIVKPLAEEADARLKRLGYDVVKRRVGDGYYGWPGDVQFDAVIVTCAAGQIPPPLIKQLAPGGRMVIPIGGAFATQSLVLVEKGQDGTVRSKSLMGVQFVPLLREDTSRK